MRYIVILPLVAAVALAGCNKAADTKPKAGHWDYTMKMVSIDAPNMPAELKTMMESQMTKQVQTFATCLTAEQAAKADSSFMPQGSAPPGCTSSAYTMKDGKLEAAWTCTNSPSQMKSMNMSGTYGPEVLNAKMTAAMEIMPGTPMTVVMSMDGKRAGDCTGSEPGAPAAK